MTPRPWPVGIALPVITAILINSSQKAGGGRSAVDDWILQKAAKSVYAHSLSLSLSTYVYYLPSPNALGI